jgi:hypothetical protein
MKCFIREEGGQIVLLVALLMTILMGVTALVVDMGSLYLEKNRLQKMVDAAALAGAQELPGKVSNIKKVIDETILANEGDPNNFSILTNNSNTILEVSGRVKGTLHFAKVIGVNEPTVEAKATVEFRPIVSIKGAIPLAVPKTQDISFGSRVTLKEKHSENGFSALRLSGKGASDFEEDVKNGYGEEIKIGDQFEVRQGAMVGKTESAFSTRINDCRYATYLRYPAKCRRVVVVPVYKDSDDKKTVIITGFATFFIESVDKDEVIGRFIKTTVPGETTSDQSADFGTYSYKLTR